MVTKKKNVTFWFIFEFVLIKNSVIYFKNVDIAIKYLISFKNKKNETHNIVYKVKI